MIFFIEFELTQGFESVLMSSFPVLLKQNGMTPLHLAVWYSLRAEDCSTVKTLLEYNADCSAKDNVLWATISCYIYILVKNYTVVSCNTLDCRRA